VSSTRSERPLRVALLIEGLGSGGAERQCALLLDELVRQGHDATLVYYLPLRHHLSGLSEAARARVVLLEKGSGARSLLFPARLAAYLRRLRPDVVLSFLRGPSRWMGLVAPPRRARPYAWVATERSQFAYPPRVRGYQRLLRRADGVVVNSFTALEELRAMGIPDALVRYVPNGVRLPDAPPSFDRPAGPIRLLAVGSIQAYKNHLKLVQALARLADRPWHLDVAGRVEQPELFARIEAEIAAAGIGGRITFHGEIKDLGPLYARSHLMVLPSDVEGFPNVLLESWMHGTPALVSDRCDLPRLVVGGGWSFPLDTPDGLDRALLAAMSMDRSALAEIGRGGYALVRERYALPAVAEAWVAALTELAAQRSR
jgi:glycosyltransferase involved in cell wall biosynthesis